MEEMMTAVMIYLGIEREPTVQSERQMKGNAPVQKPLKTCFVLDLVCCVF